MDLKEQQREMETNLLKKGWKYDPRTPREESYQRIIKIGCMINKLKGKNWHSIIGGNGMCECGSIVSEDEFGKPMLCSDLLAKAIKDEFDALREESETNTDTPPEFLAD